MTNKGRMKFCRPIYRLLNKQAPELAKKTFLEHASFYVSTSPIRLASSKPSPFAIGILFDLSLSVFFATAQHAVEDVTS